jgi:leucyl-tRNA synthetase
MPKLNHSANQTRWSQYWEENQLNKTPEIHEGDNKKYILDMFPYPSGAGLHVGHPRGYLATDALARYYRHQGFKVLHPMGWDAFGLPAEQNAIKTGIHPSINTQSNIANFKRQLKSLGLSYDWEREIDTTDPNYYRWTQWIFLQLFHKGLAYESETPVNWCPQLGTILSNEEIVNGVSERGGHPVLRIPIKQWLLKITAYADRLLDDLDTLDEWPNKIRLMQENWIGKSEGYEVDFEVDNDISMNNYLFLHGWEGTSQSCFFPWLKHELESRGARVTSLDLPNTITPKEFEQVDFVSENYVFDENTVVVTHSLGTVIGLKIVQKLKGQIKEFISIAGFADNNWKFEAPFEPDFNFNFDFTSIKKNCAKFLVFSDVNDDLVKQEQGEYLARKLETQIINLESEKPHFCGTEEKNILTTLFPKIKIYTTRIDTIGGATFLVVAPEHPLAISLTTPEFKPEVVKYIEKAKSKSEMERTELTKDKAGVPTGSFAINPLTNQRLPIFVADYVMTSYGTGAIMAVPAHDQRDWDFAKKYNLEIIPTILPIDEKIKEQVLNKEICFTGEGITADMVVNGIDLGGLQKNLAIKAIGVTLSNSNVAVHKTNYKLRDWVFSRQRYWGEPMPIVFEVDEKGNRISGPKALDDTELPLLLPEVDDFNLVKPDPNSKFPEPSLAKFKDWVEVTGYYMPNGCVKIIKPGQHIIEGLVTQQFHRETNTMPQWAGSSWYYLRFMDPNNSESFCENEKLWGPVDIYVGGAEHAVLHLLYSRFWHKVLYDLGLVSTIEPFKKLINQGLIMAEDGQKMSKSLGNVVNPDEIIEEYGCDTLRLYEYFMGPFEQSISWNTSSISGVKRFLDRFYNLLDKVQFEPNTEADFAVNTLIKSVSEGIEEYKFNTIISDFMKFVNSVEKLDKIGIDQLKSIVVLLSPFAPFTAEQMWNELYSLQYTLVKESEVITEDLDQANAKNSSQEGLQPQVDGVVPAQIFAPKLKETKPHNSFFSAIRNIFGLNEDNAKDSPLEGWQPQVDGVVPSSNQGYGISNYGESSNESTIEYESVHLQLWPVFDADKVTKDTVLIGVQVNGKVRAEIELSVTESEESVKAKVIELDQIKKYTEGKEIKKFIYVAGRIVNIVIG